MNDYTRRVMRQLNANDKISFDFDGTLNTPKGKALAKRLMTNGYSVYIISARSERLGKSVYAFAEELGISKNRIYLTGSNAEKIKKILELKIFKHYDNNMTVIKELKPTDTIGVLTNY